jgi:hypothetical protein
MNPVTVESGQQTAHFVEVVKLLGCNHASQERPTFQMLSGTQPHGDEVHLPIASRNQHVKVSHDNP